MIPFYVDSPKQTRKDVPRKKTKVKKSALNKETRQTKLGSSENPKNHFAFLCFANN